MSNPVPNPGMMARQSGSPKPHDPRELSVTPEEIQERFDEALSGDDSDLASEAEMLSQAHSVLHDALQ